MFPNLRLLLGASLATVLLIAIVGGGLFAFRDPSMRIEAPQISQPLLQQPIVDDPRQPFSLSLTARRNGELQRLLALPSSPVQAYAPEPGTGFPYELGPRDSAAVEEPQDAAPGLSEQPPADSTATAAPAEAPPAAVSDVAALVEPRHPIAEPAPVAIPEPAQPTSPNDVPPTPAIPSVAATSEEPSTTASVMAALPATDLDLAALAESEDMPLPRPKPALVPSAAPDKSAKTVRLRHVKVTTSRLRRVTFRVRRPLPPPAPPVPPAQAYQFPFFDTGFGDRYDAEGRRIDSFGVLAPPATRTQGEFSRAASSAARPTR